MKSVVIILFIGT